MGHDSSKLSWQKKNTEPIKVWFYCNFTLKSGWQLKILQIFSNFFQVLASLRIFSNWYENKIYIKTYTHKQNISWLCILQILQQNKLMFESLQPRLLYCPEVKPYYNTQPSFYSMFTKFFLHTQTVSCISSVCFSNSALKHSGNQLSVENFTLFQNKFKATMLQNHKLKFNSR